MEETKLQIDKNKTFLITGAAGFIGSNLCRFLVEAGYTVYGLDNLSNGDLNNIKNYKNKSNFKFEKGDIRNLDTCLKITKGIDYVLHQAAWGSVPRSIEQPINYYDNNIAGTINMLEASRINKVSRFVYASSSSVYGDSTILPKKEGNEGTPLNPYAETKCSNENWARLYSKLYGLTTIGLRYFNIFGQNQNAKSDYSAVIPKFIYSILNNQSPVIYGNGNQSRDFTYIENVIDANMKACLAPDKLRGEVYNIAAGEQITVIQLYSIISDHLNSQIKPKLCPKRKGDILHSFADITKAKRDLNYEPQWSFKKGIIKTIDWYKKHI